MQPGVWPWTHVFEDKISTDLDPTVLAQSSCNILLLTRSSFFQFGTNDLHTPLVFVLRVTAIQPSPQQQQSWNNGLLHVVE